ncbi:class I SAM-dependent methyltransferase [Rhizobium azibense]|uniref:Methyltransferase family protein n=1 Tax=Rhizobium azibense TaxID=1136135 RepID=A0A4R3RF20_9HYPH|nr:class I SAM-dependent methyltransferase [Rhizobium azibense]TCU34148.1 hypothetical protein EV129_113133 [Rhizobium azibense]
MTELKTRSGRPASQRADELLPFIDLLKSRKVASYLEIGARHGDTFYEVMKSLPKGSLGIAVDLPGGAWGVSSSRKALDEAVSDLRNDGYRAIAHYGDSTSDEIVGSVVETASWYLGQKKFGAILIDGDHRYDGVSADWRTWGGMSRIVGFHDIAGEGVRQKTSGDLVEVPRLWRELKDQYETIEFVGPESAMGIGVILK